MDSKVKNLVKWIIENVEQESGFLTPEPSHYILADPLILTIVKIWAIDSYEMRDLIKGHTSNDS